MQENFIDQSGGGILKKEPQNINAPIGGMAFSSIPPGISITNQGKVFSMGVPSTSTGFLNEKIHGGL